MTTCSNLDLATAAAELRRLLPPSGPLREVRCPKGWQQILVRVIDLAEQLKAGSALYQLCPGLRYAGWPVKAFEERWEPPSPPPTDGDTDDEDLTMTARAKPLKELSHRELKEACDQAEATNGNGVRPPGKAPAPTAQVESIELARLKPSPTNPRKNFNAAKLQELADSIKNHGVLQAILVRPITRTVVPGKIGELTGYEIVAGERRYRAAQLAGLFAMPCMVRSLVDREVREIQLIENVQREDLTPLEEAEGFQRMVAELNYTAAAIAQATGKGRSYVFAALKLLDLPADAKQALLAGNLSRSVAELIARVPDTKRRQEFAKVCVAGNYGTFDCPLTYQAAKELLHEEYMRELKGAPFPLDRVDLVAKCPSCQACPKRTGNQPDLYAGSRPDVCTDPACYAQKEEAWKDLAHREGAKAAGDHKLLPRNKCENLFPEFNDGGARLYEHCDYVDLAAKPPADPKKRTWGGILGEAEKDAAVAAVDRKGKLHLLVNKQAAFKVLEKETGKKLTTPATSNDYLAQERKRQEKAKVKAEVVRRALARVAELTKEAVLDSDPETNELLRPLLVESIKTVWHDARQVVKKRRGEDPEKLAKTYTGADLIALWAEVIAARKLHVSAWEADGSDAARQAFLKPFGFDWIAELAKFKKAKVKKPAAAAAKKARAAS